MKMLKVHQNALTSMLKSENFSGVIPPDSRIKRGGEKREGLGRERTGIWPTQKLSRGAPYALGGDIEIGSNLSNYSKFASKYCFPVVLKNYHVQGAIFIVRLHETLVTKSGFFVMVMS
jgi:hypothetical protein